MEKRTIDKFEEAWKWKYSQNPSQEVKDHMLLADCLFLIGFDILNVPMLDLLSSIANVHPNHVKNLLNKFNQENEDLRKKQAEEKVVANETPEFNKNTLPELTKEEIVEEITSVANKFQESAIEIALEKFKKPKKPRKPRKKKEE
jgi:hypothetical protein